MLTAEQEQEIQEIKQEVDVTLIRWMLSLTPLERLRVGQQYAASTWKLKNATASLRLRDHSKSASEA